jgi:hypothetical protein
LRYFSHSYGFWGTTLAEKAQVHAGAPGIAGTRGRLNRVAALAEYGKIRSTWHRRRLTARFGLFRRPNRKSQRLAPLARRLDVS